MVPAPSEKALVERVQTRFLKFLSGRCGVEPASLDLPSIESLHHLADICTFQNLLHAGEASNFFRITENSRRSRCTYDPLTLGTNDIVNRFQFQGTLLHSILCRNKSPRISVVTSLPARAVSSGTFRMHSHSNVRLPCVLACRLLP